MDETVVFTVQLVYIRGELSTRAHFKSELEADERVATRRSGGIEMETVHTGWPTKKAHVTSAVHRGEAFL